MVMALRPFNENVEFARARQQIDDLLMTVARTNETSKLLAAAPFAMAASMASTQDNSEASQESEQGEDDQWLSVGACLNYAPADDEDNWIRAGVASLRSLPKVFAMSPMASPRHPLDFAADTMPPAQQWLVTPMHAGDGAAEAGGTGAGGSEELQDWICV